MPDTELLQRAMRDIDALVGSAAWAIYWIESRGTFPARAVERLKQIATQAQETRDAIEWELQNRSKIAGTAAPGDPR